MRPVAHCRYFSDLIKTKTKSEIKMQQIPCLWFSFSLSVCNVCAVLRAIAGIHHTLHTHPDFVAFSWQRQFSIFGAEIEIHIAGEKECTMTEIEPSVAGVNFAMFSVY